MSKHEDEKTTQKLKRLSKTLGKLNEKQIKNSKIKTKPTFKTSEVIILLIITVVISLAMGAAVTYKITDSQSNLSSSLQEFVENYNYIIDNYNGDIDEESLLDSALETILDGLDQNSTYIDEESADTLDTYLEGSYQGIGIQIYQDEEGKIIIYSVFEDSPSDKAGLQAGDIIIKINDESVDGLTTEEIAEKVQSSTKTISITYTRNKTESTVNVNLDTVNIKSVSSTTYNQSDTKIGYIAVSIFANNTYEQFKEKLEELENDNIDGLIIDLRGNSGGYLSSATNIISLFLDSSHVIYQIEKEGTSTKYYSTGTKTKKYKIAVLVDSSSASASEVTASALKEQYGATIIGKTTYGKGTVQEMQTLSNGDQYKITTKNWLTSKGTWVDGTGITPDIEVSLDQGYYDNPSDETDNQLQAALKQIAQ